MPEKTERNLTLHKFLLESANNNNHTVREEKAMYGPKGFSFLLFIKNNNDKKKYIGKLDKENKNEYRFIEIHNDDKKVEDNLTLEKLLDRIKKIPDLEFVFKVIDKKKVAKGGAIKKDSKKVSKKVSKKASKKGSKKAKK